jgi:hypothetical protein
LWIRIGSDPLFLSDSDQADQDWFQCHARHMKKLVNEYIFPTKYPYAVQNS